jgi:beta-N-acetylglucosaminidase
MVKDTAEGGKRMRLSDENTRESKHLTLEERIALQAEEIKQLLQENEQLRARVAQYREALIIANHRMPDVAAKDSREGK